MANSTSDLFSTGNSMIGRLDLDVVAVIIIIIGLDVIVPTVGSTMMLVER